MRRAVDGLAAQIGAPAHVLVDGNKLPDWPYAGQAVIGGDGLSPSIAAASILAKVTRDRDMAALDAAFPGYGWASNKGYGAKAHKEGLEKLGVTRITANLMRRLPRYCGPKPLKHPIYGGCGAYCG